MYHLAGARPRTITHFQSCKYGIGDQVYELQVGVFPIGIGLLANLTTAVPKPAAARLDLRELQLQPAIFGDTLRKCAQRYSFRSRLRFATSSDCQGFNRPVVSLKLYGNRRCARPTRHSRGMLSDCAHSKSAAHPVWPGIGRGSRHFGALVEPIVKSCVVG